MNIVVPSKRQKLHNLTLESLLALPFFRFELLKYIDIHDWNRLFRTSRSILKECHYSHNRLIITNSKCMGLIKDKNLPHLFLMIDFSRYNPLTIDLDEALEWACENDHVNVVKILLSAEIKQRFPNFGGIVIDVDDPRKSLTIETASGNGAIGVVKYLLSDEIYKRYPLLVPSNWAVRDAIYHHHNNVAKFLLSEEIKQCYPSFDLVEDNIIDWACSYGDVEIVEFLFSEEIKQRFPSMSIDRGTLVSACKLGRMEIVQYLCSEEIAPHFQLLDAAHNQAIYYAVKCDQLAIAKFLCSKEIRQRFPKIDPVIALISGTNADILLLNQLCSLNN